MTILLVEDNPDDVELTLHALREGVPATIEVARDGQQALDYLFDESHELPRLVVLDLRLPRPDDGLEVLRRIRENERTQLTPVVILTSSEDPDDLVRGYRLGANSYVRKPLDYEELCRPGPSARHILAQDQPGRRQTAPVTAPWRGDSRLSRRAADQIPGRNREFAVKWTWRCLTRLRRLGR